MKTFSDCLRCDGVEHCTDKMVAAANELAQAGHKNRHVAQGALKAALHISSAQTLEEHRYFLRFLEELARESLARIAEIDRTYGQAEENSQHAHH